MKYMKLIQAKLITEVTVMHENKMYILRKHSYFPKKEKGQCKSITYFIYYFICEHGCFAH